MSEDKAPGTPLDEARHGDHVESVAPGTLTGVEIGRPLKYAAGVPAVIESFKFAFKNLGPVNGTRVLLALNQTDGFDCPGCAWQDPEPNDRSFAEFCENGAKAASEENTRKRVEEDFWREHSVAELSQRSDYWLAQQGRITRPMILRSGATHYEPVSWDDAFALIARKLNALAHPDEAAF